uniref:3CxxC-type domain-containing protein n=1 Tax=Takifugu rubripes TaxID=31033 RepID=H2SWU6_TAKRU
MYFCCRRYEQMRGVETRAKHERREKQQKANLSLSVKEVWKECTGISASGLDRMEWTSNFAHHIKALECDDSWNLEFDDKIDPKNPDPGWRTFMWCSSAWFKCSGCKRSWPSNNVMVAFHMRLMDKEGTVKVKRFRQSCKICSNAPMETPDISPENIDILMEKLVQHIEAKCYGKVVNFGSGRSAPLKVRNKHEPEHCEGCKAGVCRRGGI